MNNVVITCPYFDADSSVQQQRYEQARKFIAEKFPKWLSCYCHAITLHETFHELIAELQQPENRIFQWWKSDELRECDSLLVLRLDGWSRSMWVCCDMAFAQGRGIPIYFTDP